MLDGCVTCFLCIKKPYLFSVCKTCLKPVLNASKEIRCRWLPSNVLQIFSALYFSTQLWSRSISVETFSNAFKRWGHRHFFNNFILHFRDFQHTFINNTNFNNFLTNNSINICFSASFTPSSLKVEHRCYAWAEKELLSPRNDLMAQGVAYRCSKVECEDHLAIPAPPLVLHS